MQTHRPTRVVQKSGKKTAWTERESAGLEMSGRNYAFPKILSILPKLYELLGQLSLIKTKQDERIGRSKSNLRQYVRCALAALRRRISNMTSINASCFWEITGCIESEYQNRADV